MSDSIQLRPNWKRWFWGYAIGVLLIPLLGLGLFIIWRVYNTQRSYLYTVTNRRIKSVDRTFSSSVDLSNIIEVSVTQNLFQNLFGIGDVKVATDSREIVLLGQEDPEQLAETLRHAVQAEKKRIEQSKNIRKRPEPPAPPGTLDKMDYLTGLWQQGLISEEDFKKEKKHFDS